MREVQCNAAYCWYLGSKLTEQEDYNQQRREIDKNPCCSEKDKRRPYVIEPTRMAWNVTWAEYVSTCAAEERLRSTFSIHRQEGLCNRKNAASLFLTCRNFVSKKRSGCYVLPAAIDPTVSWPRLSFWLCRFWELLFSGPPWPGPFLFRERRAG
jgi:hypothetical protein